MSDDQLLRLLVWVVVVGYLLMGYAEVLVVMGADEEACSVVLCGQVSFSLNQGALASALSYLAIKGGAVGIMTKTTFVRKLWVCCAGVIGIWCAIEVWHHLAGLCWADGGVRMTKGEVFWADRGECKASVLGMALELGVAVPLIVVAEELMFRGAIPWGLSRCGIGSMSACALSSIVFAAAHGPQSVVGYLELTSAGVVLMIVRVWGGLRAAMVCHAVYLWTIALLPV
ncbi:MAG: CPBP family intramembrane metalloprotease [Planctomycetes bacterium]|nr:CPBP family intramembrane metalloprotease [Planctomycetota bacterium]